MALFDNIKKYSKLRGYNLQTTAEKAGLSKNAIYGYNHGKQPSVETLKSFALHLLRHEYSGKGKVPEFRQRHPARM